MDHLGPTGTLPNLIEETIAWIQEIRRKKGRDSSFRKIEIPCSLSDLVILYQYVSSSIVSIDPDFSSRMDAKFGINEVWKARSKPKNYMKFTNLIVSFTWDLKELFKVPKFQHEDGTLNKNELMARFLDFLDHLLTDKRTPALSGVNRAIIDVIYVRKELRYFVTVFWDTPFQASEHSEQVHNLLVQFGELANAAGRYVHSLSFFPGRVVKRVEQTLLEPISLLKADIVEFLNSMPNLTYPKIINYAVDSLFVVDSLLHDLKDVMNWNYNAFVEVKDQIEMLHQELTLSRSLLKEHLEAEDFKETMMLIQNIAYEAEYLVSYFLLGYVPGWYLAIRLESIVHRVKLIGTKLQEMMEKNSNIGSLQVADNLSTQLSLQASRDTLVNDIVVGFEDEKTSILDQLVGGPKHLQIISIVGMPGLGKTTLAKELYNHPFVVCRFDKRCWYGVSQTYRKKKLLIAILMSLGEDFDKNVDEESAALRIHKTLKGRRYLIILDDIWNINVWDDIRRYFPDDENGSRIVFTSRGKDMVPSSSIILALPLSSNDQCWELLKKKVFQNKPYPSQLQGIGKKIAASCSGLPLAVVVTAGILFAKDKDLSTWENVGQILKSYIFSDQSNSIVQILELSYKQLPRHLKPCFLYFGIFQDNREIPVQKLIQLWIAEGFIHDGENKRAETIANKYLSELIHKSLVIVAKRRSNGGAKVCIMHDLLRDMCLRIAEKENFLKLIDHDLSVYDQRYHRVVFQSSPTHSQPYGPWIRSFFCHSQLDKPLSLVKMKLLRVLDFRTGLSTYDLDGIEPIVNLRYLAIGRAPESIDNYANLEYLIVGGEVYISPLLLLKMEKLRHVKASRVVVFDHHCNISRPNKLEYLSLFLVRGTMDTMLLKHSPHLRQLKCSYSVIVGARGEYHRSNLSFLTQLQSLTVSVFRRSRVLDIIFPTNIRKLTLFGWHLSGEKLSVIGGLPNLVVLKLEKVEFVEEKWDTRDDEFQQLKFLKLKLFNLGEWNVSSWEHFPNLQQLILGDCYNLKEIPSEIGDISSLQLIEVYGSCRKSMADSAMQIQQEQEELENLDLRVIIRDIEYRSGVDISSSYFDKFDEDIEE